MCLENDSGMSVEARVRLRRTWKFEKKKLLGIVVGVGVNLKVMYVQECF